jgi:hypothetical protein
MNNIIGIPKSWQELHDVGVQLRKDYDDLHRVYLEQVEATVLARRVILNAFASSSQLEADLILKTYLDSHPEDSKV